MKKKLKVHILWHLHQPIYSLADTKTYILPWTRFHAIKAYYDMAHMALKHPQMGMTINLTPSLLQQLQDYEKNFYNDYYIELSSKDPQRLSKDEKQFIVDKFFQCSWDTMINPYPGYKRLLMKKNEGKLDLFSDQDILDLQLWFNLTWFGFIARQEFPEIKQLIQKNANFTKEDIQTVLKIQKTVVERIIPLFQKIHKEHENVEISTTPYYHPILPLVHNTETARRCMPQWPMPTPYHFPQDAKEQVRKAIELYKSIFQEKPKGFWPAEGSVSPEVAEIFIENDVQWIATDEEVLLNSISNKNHNQIFHPYSYNNKLRMFFRDKGISDAIGFKYSKMTTMDAIQDFMHNLENIAQDHSHDHISVILDGENPWEYYPDGGESFLNELYTQLVQSPVLQPMSMACGAKENQGQSITDLYSASWIMGNFQIWIGNPEDNMAWEYLRKTREAIAQEEQQNPKSEKVKQALEYIYVAEGSDWFWWYGDDFQSDSKIDFDTIFRNHLMAAWQALGQEVPTWLYTPITKGHPKHKSTEPMEFIEPKIDGKISSYYEWHGSISFDTESGGSAIYNSQNIIKKIFWGFNAENLYMRIDFNKEIEKTKSNIQILLQHKQSDRKGIVLIHLEKDESHNDAMTLIIDDKKSKTDQITWAMENIFEIMIPFKVFNGSAKEEWQFLVELKEKDTTIEKQPLGGLFKFVIPDQIFKIKNWFV